MKKKYEKNTKNLTPTFLTENDENEIEEGSVNSFDLPLFVTTFEQREIMNKVMEELEQDRLEKK